MAVWMECINSDNRTKSSKLAYIGKQKRVPQISGTFFNNLLKERKG